MMRHQDAIRVADKVDRLILESRLRDVALTAQSDRSDRVGVMATVLSRLPSGGYLLGCGPYCCGILPLTVDEVVLGRPPSPLEALPDTVADYTLNDAVWMVPREASRIHATILRHRAEGVTEYAIRDERSRTGTFVNGRRVGADDEGNVTTHATELSNGDVIALGPSGINSYVFILVP